MSPRSATLLAAFLAVGTALPASARAGAIVTFGLGSANVTESAATFEVILTFEADDPADTVDAIQLSVLESSAELTDSGMDFGRFSFALDPSAAPGFEVLAPLSLGGLALIADPNGLATIAPSASPFLLGVLSVDLAGLPLGQPLTVRLTGPPGLGGDASGVVGGDPIGSFAMADPAVASIDYANPDGSTFTLAAIPEPSSLALVLPGSLFLVALARRVRGRTRASAGTRRRAGRRPEEG